jgi:hypothetical protein
MGVYELSGAGSVKTGRTLYTSMNANNSYGAMVPIATYVPNGSTGAFEFAGIPSTFQDLMLVGYCRSSEAVNNSFLFIRPNVTQYWSGTRLIGDGSSATSSRYSNNASDAEAGVVVANSATSGIFGSFVYHILNYTSSKHKTSICRSVADTNGQGKTALYVLKSDYTSAITNIVIYNASNTNWVSGSTFTLYGIRAVSS